MVVLWKLANKPLPQSRKRSQKLGMGRKDGEMMKQIGYDTAVKTKTGDIVVIANHQEYNRKEHTQKSMWDHLRSLKDAARSADTGTRVMCPTCGKLFKKMSYQSTFCSNQYDTGRKNGKGNCKDAFNNVFKYRRRYEK